MRSLLITILFALVACCAQAKQSYVPKYNSVISIYSAGDTLFEDNNRAELVVAPKNKTFRVAVVHEVLTVKRIKSIKTNETIAALFGFSMSLNTLSTFSPDRKTCLSSKISAYSSATLASIYTNNSESEKKLGIDVIIENTSSEEIMINDIEKGLTWFVRPGSSINFPVNNPDIIKLRVSDLHQKYINYVEAGGGSLLKSINIEWENDDYWAFPLIEDDEGYLKTIAFMLISKATGDSRRITKEELKAIKKENKTKN